MDDKTEYNINMIKAYVPEADMVSWEEALELALERDAEATRVLEQDWQEAVGYSPKPLYG